MKRIVIIFVAGISFVSTQLFASPTNQVSGSEAGDLAIQYLGSEVWDFRLPWLDVDDSKTSSAGWETPKASAGSYNIAIGCNSDAEGNASLAIGGLNAWATGQCAAAIGGLSPHASGNCSIALGGNSPYVSGTESAIVGGYYNDIIDSRGAAILGGIGNGVSADFSSITGGQGNDIFEGTSEIISGGAFNQIYAVSGSSGRNVVAGGYYNLISNVYHSIVGGGNNNVIINESTAIYGHTIAGGVNNLIKLTNAALHASTIGGGLQNTISNSDQATISGGDHNVLTVASRSTIAGGYGNSAVGTAGSILGGWQNTANGDYAVVAGGYCNRAIGTCATALGGNNNVATGNYSVALGYRATALQGSFVFAAPNSGLTNAANNQFWVKAPGGTRFISNDSGTTGVELPAGGNGWNVLCDRKLKHQAKAIANKEALDALMTLSVETFKTEVAPNMPGEKVHLGIMANEFNDALEGLGADRNVTAEGYNTLDTTAAMAMSVAAIQAQQEQIKALKSEIAQLQARLGQP